MTQTITVQDTTSPDFLTIPEDLTIECSDEDLEAVDENAIAGDLCGPVVVEYVNEFSLTDAVSNYVVTRTFTATDDAGNFSTAVQVVTEDTTAPEFTFVPGDLTIECSAEELMLSENATAGDLCGPVTGSTSTSTVYDALGGTLTRTFTATDDAGNFSTAVQIVMFRTPPHRF